MPDNASARLRAISVALREAGDRENLNAMRRGIRATAPVGIEAVRAAARAQLPKSGGLNEYEASQKIRVAVLGGARSAGVRVIGKASRSTDTGTWRHPDPSMLGYHRSYYTWVEQTYAPAAGWWTKTWEHNAATIQAGIVSQLTIVEAKIAAL